MYKLIAMLHPLKKRPVQLKYYFFDGVECR